MGVSALRPSREGDSLMQQLALVREMLARLETKLRENDSDRVSTNMPLMLTSRVCAITGTAPRGCSTTAARTVRRVPNLCSIGLSV